MLRRSLFCLLILLPRFFDGFAEEDAKRSYDYLFSYKLFEGRLLLGANFSQLDGDTYAGYHKVGLNTGAEVYVHFNQAFGTSFELFYSQKGVRGGTVKESYTLGTYIDKYYLNFNYAQAVAAALQYVHPGLRSRSVLCAADRIEGMGGGRCAGGDRPCGRSF